MPDNASVPRSSVLLQQYTMTIDTQMSVNQNALVILVTGKLRVSPNFGVPMKATRRPLEFLEPEISRSHGTTFINLLTQLTTHTLFPLMDLEHHCVVGGPGKCTAIFATISIGSDGTRGVLFE